MTKHSHPTDTAPPIIVPFLGYLSTVTGKSPKTVQEYYLDLRTFFRYMKRSRGLVPADVPFSDIDISDIDLALVRSITLSDVYEYMNFLSTTRGNAEAARARKVSSLRTFFKYLTIKANLLERNPIEELETPKLKKSLPKYLTLEQSQKLLHEPCLLYTSCSSPTSPQYSASAPYPKSLAYHFSLRLRPSARAVNESARDCIVSAKRLPLHGKYAPSKILLSCDLNISINEKYSRSMAKIQHFKEWI